SPYPGAKSMCMCVCVCECVCVCVCMCFTFGVKRDEAVTERPLLHRLTEYDLLGEDHHGDVLELTEPLHDLRHGLGPGLLHHRAKPHAAQPLGGRAHREGA